MSACSYSYGYATGPKSKPGKAIAARNATTHGLFARDIVLTHLGEDPQGYETLLDELKTQIKPHNLIEQHYVEKIAAASWRLRRLQRWQAQLFEDISLTEDDRLDKLDKVLRHETALHRQIDTAVKILSRDVPRLFEQRSREVALSLVQVTERDCARSEDTDWEVARTARELRAFKPAPEDFDPEMLDNTHSPAENGQNCENELPDEPEEETIPDINYVHPDGRPVYLEPTVWANMLYCRAHGEEARAEEWDQYYRRCYLEEGLWAETDTSEE